jgi:hypothetical protein
VIREALALIIPACAIGALVPSLRLCLGRPSRVSAIALALCLGIGFSSVTTTALIVMGVAPQSGRFILVDAMIWGIVGVTGWWVRRGRFLAGPPMSGGPVVGTAPSPVDWIVRVAFGATAAVALAAVMASALALPHGEWDAWAIWNQHARFMFRGGDTWRAMLEIEWSQPGYPLLLPASVARVWAYAGRETTMAPAMIGIVFGVASVTFVMTALDLGRRRAWMAGAILLGAGPFLVQVPSQCADVPLACFIVATLAVACGPAGLLTGRERPHVAALVAGSTSAMAAWTKNEGLVFALLMLLFVAMATARRGTPRQLLWWMAGGAPVFITIVWFKLALAPSSSLFEGQSLAIYADRLFDLDRHAVVATLMARHMVHWGAPLAVAIVPLVGLTAIGLAIVKGGVAMRLMLAVVGLMFVAYYTVYLTAPFDLTWYVSTSFDRLLAQQWPALVLAASLAESAQKTT